MTDRTQITVCISLTCADESLVVDAAWSVHAQLWANVWLNCHHRLSKQRGHKIFFTSVFRTDIYVVYATCTEEHKTVKAASIKVLYDIVGVADKD